ncbi:MAG TPA: hypothetical protein VMM82_13120, partial [Spirochaetia bacterium]|nr:hypothetical protein [Spirochaetia bacterium]
MKFVALVSAQAQSLRSRVSATMVLHAAEVAYSLLLLAWFLAPLFTPARDVMAPPLLPLSFLDVEHGRIMAFLIVTCVAYPIPLLCAAKIAAVFLERRVPSLADPTRIVPIVLNALASALAVAVLMIQMVAFASGPGWFRGLPWLASTVFFLSVAWNAWSLVRCMEVVNRSDPAYQEYAAYRRRPRAKRHGIQRRLALTMLPFVLAVIILPALVMLRDFSRTALASSIADGKALAERAASVVRTSNAAPGALAGFMTMEGRRNRGSDFPFRAVSYIDRDSRSGSFEVVASTDRS